MWASSLPQYCSGPVDGNLYAIVKKTADGDWIEESSAGEDSGCGASSNIGYKPDASTGSSGQPQQQQPPPTPPLRSTSSVPPADPAKNLDDGFNSLLEGLLKVGSTPAAAPAAETDREEDFHPSVELETELERQLAAELARTRRQIERRMRRLLRPSKSNGRRRKISDCDHDDEDEEACFEGGALERPKKPVTSCSDRGASTLPASRSHSESWQRQSSYQRGNEIGHRHESFHREERGHHGHREQHEHQEHHEHHEHHKHHEHHEHRHEQHQHQEQKQLQVHPSQCSSSAQPCSANLPASGNCANSLKSVYSTPDGDIQIQLGESANQFGAGLFSRAPLWERQFRHPQLNSLPRPAKERPAPPPAACTLRPPQHRRSERFDDPAELAKSRDLLELRLQELQAQMCATRDRTQQRQQQPQPTSKPCCGTQPRQDDRQVTATIQQRVLAQEPPPPSPKTYQEVEMITMQPIGRGIHDLGTYSGSNLRGKCEGEQQQQQPSTAESTPRRPIIGERDRTSHGIASVSNQSCDGSSTTPRASGTPQRQQPIKIDWSQPSRDAGSNGHRSQETMPLWYRPAISREETVNLLRSAPPGSFLIRDSTSFPGAFGLAVKTDAGSGGADAVRHFLLEPAAGGVRLRGSPSEPAFAGLAAFVEQHAVDRLALPCRLRLPDLPGRRSTRNEADGLGQGMYDNPDQIVAAASASESVPSMNSLQQGGVGNSVYPVSFLGSVSVESLVGSEAVTRAVSLLLGAGIDPSLNSADCQLRVEPDALILSDQQRKPFFRKHFPLSAILHCGFDGLNRRLGNRSLYGLVVRTGARADNLCVVFSDVELGAPGQSAWQQQPTAQLVIAVVNQALLGATANGRMR